MNWRNNVELYNEIIFNEARRRAESGKLNISVEELAEAFYEEDRNMYYFLTSRFGGDVATNIAAEAERNYLSGYNDHVYETMKERYRDGKEETKKGGRN